MAAQASASSESIELEVFEISAATSTAILLRVSAMRCVYAEHMFVFDLAVGSVTLLLVPMWQIKRLTVFELYQDMNRKLPASGKTDVCPEMKKNSRLSISKNRLIAAKTNITVSFTLSLLSLLGPAFTVSIASFRIYPLTPKRIITLTSGEYNSSFSSATGSSCTPTNSQG